MNFPLPENTVKDDIKFEVTIKEIKLSVKMEELYSANLYSAVDTDVSFIRIFRLLLAFNAIISHV